MRRLVWLVVVTPAIGVIPLGTEAQVSPRIVARTGLHVNMGHSGNYWSPDATPALLLGASAYLMGTGVFNVRFDFDFVDAVKGHYFFPIADSPSDPWTETSGVQTSYAAAVLLRHPSGPYAVLGGGFMGFDMKELSSFRDSDRDTFLKFGLGHQRALDAGILLFVEALDSYSVGSFFKQSGSRRGVQHDIPLTVGLTWK